MVDPVVFPHAAAPIQRLDLTIDALKAAGGGAEVRTDHPVQPALRLRLLVVPLVNGAQP